MDNADIGFFTFLALLMIAVGILGFYAYPRKGQGN